MHCTDNRKSQVAEASVFHFWSSWRGWALVSALGGAAWLAGCGTRSAAPLPPAPSAAPARQAPTQTPVARPATPAPAAAPAARSAAEYKLQAARKLMAANPNLTYAGEVPEPLLAIPVLEVELHADGSIAKINVLRQPSQAKDTTQMAIDAVKRAAPFGDVSRLPKPWRYTEAFLFRDDRKFKPRSLD